MYERIVKSMKEKAEAQAAAESRKQAEEQRRLNALREEFCEALRHTGRVGVDGVIRWLSEESDFFSAPASTRFHGNYPGGLLEHSLNVYHVALRLRESLTALAPEKACIHDGSIAIAALLHDVCKANVYKPAMRRQQVDGVWTDVPAYSVSDAELPVGHGEKSVIMLLRMGLQLTDDEILAIRWHMNAWEIALHSSGAKAHYGVAKEQCPLVSLLQSADDLAANFLEETK